MQTIVTAYESNVSYLECSRILMNKFYPSLPVLIDIAGKKESKATQLRRLRPFLDEYFILLEEDFYLVYPVDVALLQEIYTYCVDNKVDRFSLQTRNAHGHPDYAPIGQVIAGHTLYECVPDAKYPYCLEASIWRRDFFYSLLCEWDGSDRDIELYGSKKCKVSSRIYALDHSVIDYRDAMRGGKREIHLRVNPLRLVGPAELLYPDGKCKDTVKEV